ncbi:hypothetical protein AGMMS49975_06020 [Clostridia bacterium]|nr:hypothetical protein AGMMS49975_06020 [Clostridia bacterium]
MHVPTETTSKSDYFRKMYRAHEIIADISERIDKLYSSATSISPVNDGMPKSPNPQRFESIIVEMADLRTYAEKLLSQRAKFDLFVTSLNPFYARLLSLRCGQSLSWKESAQQLDISEVSAKRIYRKCVENADEAGLFVPVNPNDTN